jgi:hypothetical protein
LACPGSFLHVFRVSLLLFMGYQINGLNLRMIRDVSVIPSPSRVCCSFCESLLTLYSDGFLLTAMKRVIQVKTLPKPKQSACHHNCNRRRNKNRSDAMCCPSPKCHLQGTSGNLHTWYVTPANFRLSTLLSHGDPSLKYY